jgi:SAM-dependent methyltransferase
MTRPPKDEQAIERMRDELRERVRAGDPAAFEQLYRSAGGDASKVPWAELAPNANVTRWLDREMPGGGEDGKRALVVGCGLGDDAEELARRGFAVTAFDISPTAIDWSRRRFPRSRVEYVQADLIQTPAAWAGAFDFALESYTIQAMGSAVRDRALRQVASFVAPSGTLLIVCRARDDEEPPGELPQPLSRRELSVLGELGFSGRSFEDYIDDEVDPPVRRFRASYVR